jgi:hypothetical protein
VFSPGELDAHADWMQARDVEAAAWAYARKGMKVGLGHRQGTTGMGQVVESFVHRGPPWRVRDVGGEEQVVQPGAWLLGVTWSPEAWAEIESGRVTGYSLQGWAHKAIERAARERITREGGGGMPLLGMDNVPGADGEGRQREQLSPAIREAINAALREALKQALPRLADELESRFRSDVAELRRSLDARRVGVGKSSASDGPAPAPSSIIHWGSDRARR